MKNDIHLIRKLLVYRRYQALDSAVGVSGDGAAVRKRLLRKRLHRSFDRSTRFVRLWLELFVQE